MSSTYTTNRYMTQAPSPAPTPGTSPIEVLPSDGDPASAASVVQAFKVVGDNVDMLTHREVLLNEQWRYTAGFGVAAATNTSPWDTSHTSAGTVLSLPTTTYPFMYQGIGSTNGTQWMFHGGGGFPGIAQTVVGYVVEWDATLSAVNAGTAVQMGLVSATNVSLTTAATDCAYIELVAGSGTWTARTRASSTSTVVNTNSAAPNTGLPSMANTRQRMRIEVYPSSLYGGSTTVTFKAGSTTLGSSTTNLSTSGFLYFGVQLVETAIGNTLYLGPVKVSVF